MNLGGYATTQALERKGCENRPWYSLLPVTERVGMHNPHRAIGLLHSARHWSRRSGISKSFPSCYPFQHSRHSVGSECSENHR